jgi:hypothetical protein
MRTAIWLRVFAALAAAGSLVLACGGRTAGRGGEGSSSGASSGGGSTGASGSPGNSGGSGAGSSSAGGGNVCVFIDYTAYDTSCRQDSDCVPIQVGNVCDGQCACGNYAMNGSEEASYEAALAGVQPAVCFCPSQQVACVTGQCSLQSGIDVDASAPKDAGPAPDGGACVYVDLSTYDQSCQVDGDCTTIRSGLVCAGACNCGGDSPINVDGEARYQATVASLSFPSTCLCPPPTPVRCVAKRCTA